MHPASSLQDGPMPSGWAPSGTLSDSSAPHSTHLRLRFLRSARRCSASAFALSRAAFASSLIIPILFEGALDRLDRHRDALTPADAGGPDTIPSAAAAKLVKQMCRDPRPGRAQRVTDRDGPAVHVGLLARQLELLRHRQVLRREGLVD